MKSLVAVVWIVLSVGCASTTERENRDDDPAVPDRPIARSSSVAVADAMSLLGVEKNDEGVLLLTNAGYARPDGQGTEFFADVATEVSGCSIGKRSLYFLHSPSTAPLWFALFRRDTRQVVFCKWMRDDFEGQRFDADPDLLGRPDAWGRVTSGPVGGSLFSILTVSNAWAQGADPLLLRCAAFHNHCCGGVTAGYLAGRYIQARFPLRDGERYLFVTASPSCAMDALQVMFDATAGKKGMFSTRADAGALSEFSVDDARPLTIVMRVDESADTCDGMLLGFAWDRTGQTSKIWNVTEVEKLECVRVLKRFSGTASLAWSLTETDADPYGTVWDESLD